MTSLFGQSLSNPFEIKSGMIQPFGGTTAPAGWLICDGSAISRTTYKRLFNVIGTKYGSGDGSTTFNLPNLSGGCAIKYDGGHALGTTTAGGAPNVTGTLSVRGAGTNSHIVQNTSGCFSSEDTSQTTAPAQISGTSAIQKITISASDNSSVYGTTSGSILPKGQFTNYIIKY